MNLLAAAAAFGVLVAVFQFGWGLHALNLGQAGPVEAFLPVLILSVLFGLSMDYEVFLVSRIREEWVGTHDNHEAVRTGQATTGRVIIAAATIMILVFTRSSSLVNRSSARSASVSRWRSSSTPSSCAPSSSPPSCTCSAGPTGGCSGWLGALLPHLSIEPVAASPPPNPAPVSEVTYTRSRAA